MKKGEHNEIDETKIRKFLTNATGWIGLYYGFQKNAKIGVEINEKGFRCGVVADPKNFPEEYEKIKKELRFGESSGWWPAQQYIKSELNFRHPTPEVLELLLDQTKTKNFVCEIAEQVEKLWNQIKRADLVQFPQ